MDVRFMKRVLSRHTGIEDVPLDVNPQLGVRIVVDTPEPMELTVQFKDGKICLLGSLEGFTIELVSSNAVNLLPRRR